MSLEKAKRVGFVWRRTRVFFFPFWESNDLENYNNKTIKLLGDTSEEISFITTYFFFFQSFVLHHVIHEVLLLSDWVLGSTYYLFFFFFFDKLHE